MIRNKLELYLHIPFCKQKCKYCDFLSAPVGSQVQFAYLHKLVEEITAAGAKYGSQYEVDTIFIGGGTPSILAGGEIEMLMEAVRSGFSLAEDAEITIEANPGTLDQEKLLTYRRAGINRLSIGLQSTDDKELKCLGRIHTYEEFLESFYAAREAGFDNINIDLMSALPGQTVKSWTETLTRVIALEPEHISAYSLIIEEGTPFYELYGEDAEKENELPGEEADREMYHLTKTLLAEAGYQRYEISNYAKVGRECKHNLGYWQGKEYLGLGLGAASCMGTLGGVRCRFSNTGEMKEYIAMDMGKLIADSSLRAEFEDSTLQAQMEEYMFLGLRCMKGISVGRFTEVFGKSFDDVYGEVAAKLVNEELLEQSDDYLRLTERGIDVSNHVLAEFL